MWIKRCALYLGVGCAVILGSVLGPFQFMVKEELADEQRYAAVAPAVTHSPASGEWPPPHGGVAFYNEMMELVTQPMTQTTEAPEPEGTAPETQGAAPEPQATPPKQEVIREVAPADRSKTLRQRQASPNAAVSRGARDTRRHVRQRDRSEVYLQGRDGRRYRVDPGVRAQTDYERSYWRQDRIERQRPSPFWGRASRPNSFGFFGSFTGRW